MKNTIEAIQQNKGKLKTPSNFNKSSKNKSNATGSMRAFAEKGNWDLKMYCLFNPLSPNDALRHHFTSMKTDLILL